MGDKILNAILWPGTIICKLLSIDPEADAGLARWLFNTLIYVTIGLFVLWGAVAIQIS